MLSVNGYPLLYILWNLFLAAIPCFIAYFFQKKLRNKKIRQIGNRKQMFYLGLFMLWVFFLPNTVYLITMVRHLLDHCKNYDQYRVCVEQAWMVPFFFIYALVGVPTFWYSLKTMAHTLGQLIHKKVARYLPIIMIPLSALAVLFGLMERLNSWDIATRPMVVLQTAWHYVSNGHQLLNLIVYTLVLYLMYYGVEKWKEIK